MGSDLTVVNAARVSFDKESQWEYEQDFAGIPVSGPFLSEKDKKLLKYLATHGHTSPFRHCFLQFRIETPIFVKMQLEKHQIGLSVNSVSRRYVSDVPVIFMPDPDQWRKAASNKKQGSSDEKFLARDFQYMHEEVESLMKTSLQLYDTLLRKGVAPEQARTILPQNMMTSFYWSGSLQAFAHMCNLRCASDTQEETREVANEIDRLVKTQTSMTNAWSVLRKESIK